MNIVFCFVCFFSGLALGVIAQPLIKHLIDRRRPQNNLPWHAPRGIPRQKFPWD